MTLQLLSPVALRFYVSTKSLFLDATMVIFGVPACQLFYWTVRDVQLFSP